MVFRNGFDKLKIKSTMSRDTYRFHLERYAPNTRHRCPSCGKAKKFARYIDDSGEVVFPEHVGKCERVDNCGHHITPKQFFAENPEWKSGLACADWKPDREPKPVTLDYLPLEKLQASTRQEWRRQNGFWIFLKSRFGEGMADRAFEKYKVGTSKYWKLETAELATAFWQVDVFGNARQVKIMAYNPSTGRRLKEHEPAWRLTKSGIYSLDIDGQAKTAFAGKWVLGNPDANLKQCFFGEHLLADDYLADQKRPVAIVESEKTAIVCSLVFPELEWLATGGKNGCGFTSPDTATVLNGRAVHLFPDLKAFGEWYSKAEILAGMLPGSSIHCHDILERKANEDDRAAGFDLADFFLKNCDEKTGLVLANNYPASWD